MYSETKRAERIERDVGSNSTGKGLAMNFGYSTRSTWAAGHCRALFEANNARGREVHLINLIILIDDGTRENVAAVILAGLTHGALQLQIARRAGRNIHVS